jgi:hypothetical protein
LPPPARIRAPDPGRDQGGGNIRRRDGRGHRNDAAAIFVEGDLREADLAFAQNALERVTRGFRSLALLEATRMELGRIDAAQPHLGCDIESGPEPHARFERIAVQHAQQLGRVRLTDERACRYTRQIVAAAGGCRTKNIADDDAEQNIAAPNRTRPACLLPSRSGRDRNIFALIYLT